MRGSVIHCQDEEITHNVIAAAMEVHKRLGPGLLESVYKECLLVELEDRRIEYKSEVAVPVIYKSKRLDCGFRLDILVANRVIVELKSVEELLPVHRLQLVTYLRFLKKEIGLLMNFNVPLLKQGIRRCVVNS